MHIAFRRLAAAAADGRNPRRSPEVGRGSLKFTAVAPMTLTADP